VPDTAIIARSYSNRRAAYLLGNPHGLNERTVRAGPETAARWLTGEVETHFESNVRHGFAVLPYLAEQVIDKRLPMKLDYQLRSPTLTRSTPLPVT
jgi:hypothetical protein